LYLADWVFLSYDNFYSFDNTIDPLVVQKQAVNKAFFHTLSAICWPACHFHITGICFKDNGSVFVYLRSSGGKRFVLGRAVLCRKGYLSLFEGDKCGFKCG
jgi:hypothetical protein